MHRKATYPLLATLALFLPACGDDDPVGSSGCPLSTPAWVEFQSELVPGTGTLSDTATVVVENFGNETFSGVVQITPSGPTERPPTVSLVPGTSTISIAAGATKTLTLVSSIGPLTSAGEHTWFLTLGPGCDTVEVYMTVEATEAGVMRTLEDAWRRRDAAAYAGVLSDDFRFFFDPDTRSNEGLPEFWTRNDDSSAVGRLFGASEIVDIRLGLILGPVLPANELGRDHWRRLDVEDMLLEVDVQGEPEGLTLRVDGQMQKFYFRRGRTEADTLSSSPTSDRIYIAEWRDMGVTGFHGSSLFPATEQTTWSRVKTFFR